MSFKQLSVLTKNSIIGAAVSYMLTIYLANAFGAKLFGTYSYVLIISGILGLMVNYSTDVTAPKMVVATGSKQGVFDLILSLRVGALLLCVVTLLVAVYIFKFDEKVAFGVFCILLTSMNLAFLFEVSGRNMLYSYIFLLERLLYVGFVVLLLTKQEPDIMSIFWLYFSANVISLLIQYTVKFGYLKRFSLPCKSDFLRLINDNFSLLMIAMAQLAYGGFSRLIFEHKYGLEQLGIFSLGLQITAAASIFQAQVERVFRMQISAAIAGTDVTVIIAALKRYLLMSTLPIAVLAMAITYWSEEFVTLLFSDEYRSLGDLFYLFASFFVIINLNSLVIMCWVALGEQRKYFSITMTFAVILLITLYFLPLAVGVEGFIICILAIQTSSLIYALLRFFLLLKKSISATSADGVLNVSDFGRIDWSDFYHWGNESEYVKEAIDSKWVSGGQYVGRLEQQFKTLLNIPNVLAVSNGTAALQLAFLGIGIKPGDEVIVPGFGFMAAANVLRQMHAIPVFSDVCLFNWNMDVAQVKTLISAKTKAIVTIHNYGVMADMAQLAELATANNICLIEDCAEAVFSSYQGQYCGAFGDICTFSLHATKTISSGEGGIVGCKDPALYEKMALIRSHGLRRAKKHYWHEEHGNNYRLSNVLAAIGVAQCEKYEDILAQKKRVFDRYRERLEMHPLISFQCSAQITSPVIWAVAVYIPFAVLNIERDELMDQLLVSGIETRPGFYTPNELPIFDDVCNQPNRNSQQLAANIIVLPSSALIKDEVIDFVCETLLAQVNAAQSFSLTVKSLEDNDQDRALLARFLLTADSSLKAFRYFSTRDYSVLENHVGTLMLLKEGEPVVYGHLDREGDTVWLGIAAIESHKGLGLGKLMMRHLIEFAYQNGLSELVLRVDKDNSAAFNLYRNNGFIVDEHDTAAGSYLMTKTLE